MFLENVCEKCSLKDRSVKYWIGPWGLMSFGIPVLFALGHYVHLERGLSLPRSAFEFDLTWISNSIWRWFRIRFDVRFELNLEWSTYGYAY